MSDEQQTPEAEPEGKEIDQTFTQADVDRIVAERLKREREKTETKLAEVEALRTQAEGAKTAEERIAALEQEVNQERTDALRATYAADVPERLRPLLTGTTDDELKAQRDLLIESESERKRHNNRVPTEGITPTPSSAAADEREFVRQLFSPLD